MTDITRRDTLLMTAGATWAVALEARAGDPPNVADLGPARDTKPANRPVSLRDFERLAPGIDDAGGLGVHQQRRRR